MELFIIIGNMEGIVKKKRLKPEGGAVIWIYCFVFTEQVCTFFESCATGQCIFPCSPCEAGAIF